MLESGFRMDWDAVAKNTRAGVEMEVLPAGELVVEGAAGDKQQLAEGLTAWSHWPFCAWDATTYVVVVVVVVDGLCGEWVGGSFRSMEGRGGRTTVPYVPNIKPQTHFDRDASIYTPLLLDPNAVYQPQLLSFGDRSINRVYRFKAP